MIHIVTDFGLDGPYVGQMHAVLARMAPEIPAIDLMHDAPVHDARRSAYLLAALAAGIEPDSVCVAVIDPGVGGERPPVIVSADGRKFVGPGNGLFEIVQRRAASATAWQIDWRPERLSASFHGRDLFAPVAALLARGEWPACTHLAEGWQSDPTRPGAEWPDDLAEAIYIDGFGNVMTGLRADGILEGTIVEMAGQAFSRSRTFSAVAEGEGFWYENSLGLVEVAVNRGNAAQKYAVEPGEPVKLLN
jgi:S-adenosylmethionine hydrolase